MQRNAGWSFVVCCLAALALGPAARSQTAVWPVARGRSHEPAPYLLEAALRGPVPKAFTEDASACILYSGTTHLVEADGTVESITHEITRFNGRKGVEKLGEYRSISYDPAYQTLTLNEARVIKADGRRLPIEPRHLQLRDVSTDYQVYDPEKQLVISFPSLEVGDTIEVKWTTRGKNPEFAGYFFSRYNFGDDQYPVVLDDLRVRLPRSRPLKYAAVGGRLEPAIEEKGDARTYHWQVRNRRELPQDENLVSKEELRLEVACSTFASWEEVGTWKRRLRADCWQCSNDIRALVGTLTRGLTAPAEKARALTCWLRRNIRYVSVGQKHDYTPHAPAQVLANRFGDCKDQSQLLAVMLHEAGVPVALATLGARDDGQVLAAVPSPWGTHAILLVTLDGCDHWIDTTAPFAGWDFLPRDDRDRLCYIVDPDPGRPVRLRRTPALTPADNRIEQTTEVSVGADGSSRCRRAARYYGLAALAQRQDWLEAPPGERRRLLAAELQEAHSRARLRELRIDEAALKDFDRPAAAHLVFEIPGHFSGELEREGSVADPTLWGKLLTYNLDYDRQAPLELQAPFESRHRFVIHLPPGYRLESVPADRLVESRWGSFRLRVEADAADPRVLALEFHTRLGQPRVEAADFDAFRQFHEAVLKQHRVYLTLRPAPDLGDAPALEALVCWTPEDSAAAAALARLYLDNGLTTQARRVLARARAYHPADRLLLELTLRAAGSFAEEEAAYRALIGQAPDEPKYQVALGAMLVNHGEYARAQAVLEPLTARDSPGARGPAHYQLARSCWLQHAPRRALKHLDAAAQADPQTLSDLPALELKGQVQEALGRAKEATASYRAALQVDPNAQEPLAALVRLELAGQHRREALDALRRYTVAVGSDPDGLIRAADFHLRLGREDDAFELATRAREQRDTAAAHRILGLVALHRGDFGQAVADLRQAEPAADVLEGLIQGCLALGQLPEAEQQVKRAAAVPDPAAGLRRACDRVGVLQQRRRQILARTRVPPGKAEALSRAIDGLVCAEEELREGRPGSGVEASLERVFDLGIELGPAYALRGQLELERGRLSKALTDAEQAVALSPEEARGYYVRGRARLECGRQGALADLEKAAALSQQADAATLHGLAAALAQTGRFEQARDVQRQAVSQEPQNREFQEQLRKLERLSAGKPAPQAAADPAAGR